MSTTNVKFDIASLETYSRNSKLYLFGFCFAESLTVWRRAAAHYPLHNCFLIIFYANSTQVSTDARPIKTFTAVAIVSVSVPWLHAPLALKVQQLDNFADLRETMAGCLKLDPVSLR